MNTDRLVSRELLVPLEDYIHEDRLVLHEERSSSEAFTGDERTPAPSEEIEDDVVRLRTPLESFAVETRRFGGRVLVVLCREALHEPDVDHIHDVFQCAVS